MQLCSPTASYQLPRGLTNDARSALSIHCEQRGLSIRRIRRRASRLSIDDAFDRCREIISIHLVDRQVTGELFRRPRHYLIVRDAIPLGCNETGTPERFVNMNIVVPTVKFFFLA